MCTSDTAKQFFDTDILVDMLDKHKNSRHANEKTDYSRKIWAVYIFLVWYERFFGQEKPAYPSGKGNAAVLGIIDWGVFHGR